MNRSGAGGAEGVIVAQGGNIGGWDAKGGKLKYCYNLIGLQHFFVESESAIPQGDHQVRLEFGYAGRSWKGGTVSLFIDGKRSAKARWRLPRPLSSPRTMAAMWAGAPVSPDYGPRGNEFNGVVKGMQLAIAEAAEETDHLVSPEEALRIAMARQ